MYSEKATKFCEISTVDLSYVLSNGQIDSGDFAKFCGLLRIYELYDTPVISPFLVSIEYFYLDLVCRKQNKFRRFRNRENM